MAALDTAFIRSCRRVNTIAIITKDVAACLFRTGSNCWIGSKVTFLDGVKIGQGCVVAAGSVVTKSFPDFSVIGGVPAKMLKERL